MILVGLDMTYMAQVRPLIYF